GKVRPELLRADRTQGRAESQEADRRSEEKRRRRDLNELRAARRTAAPLSHVRRASHAARLRSDDAPEGDVAGPEVDLRVRDRERRALTGDRRRVRELQGARDAEVARADALERARLAVAERLHDVDRAADREIARH